MEGPRFIPKDAQINQPQDPQEAFTERYLTYQKAREELNILELREEHGLIPELTQKVLGHQEELANLTMGIYNQCSSIAEFEEKMKQILTNPATEEDAIRMGIDEPILGSYLHPLSTTNESIPSPTESIQATIENFKTISEFTNVGKKSADGLLLSRTNAWGPFYAVKGSIPHELQDAGVDQLGYSEFSDIDLFVTNHTIEGLQQVVDDYADAGLIEPKEKERIRLFDELYRDGHADIFSVRSHYRGVLESIHFMPWEKLEQMCSLQRVNPKPYGEYGLDYMRDSAQIYQENSIVMVVGQQEILKDYVQFPLCQLLHLCIILIEMNSLDILPKLQSVDPLY